MLFKGKKKLPYRSIKLSSVSGKNGEVGERTEENPWWNKLASAFQRQGHQLAKMKICSNILLASG